MCVDNSLNQRRLYFVFKNVSASLPKLPRWLWFLTAMVRAHICRSSQRATLTLLSHATSTRETTRSELESSMTTPHSAARTPLSSWVARRRRPWPPVGKTRTWACLLGSCCKAFWGSFGVLEERTEITNNHLYKTDQDCSNYLDIEFHGKNKQTICSTFCHSGTRVERYSPFSP